MAGDNDKVEREKPEYRSRYSRDPGGLVGVDGRSSWGRRFRDVVDLHLADLGGERAVTQAQLSVVRMAATMTVELERMASSFAENDGATADDLDSYQKGANSLRRLLATIGLDYRVTETTPDLRDFLKQEAASAAH